MGHFLETLQNSPYAWAVLSIVAIISLILAIYFGVSANKVKRFYYYTKTNKLVSFNSDKPSSLHLFYDDTEIQDVSVTRIAVWNSGNDVINAADIVESEPLSIKIIDDKSDDIRILDSSIDYVSDGTNKFELSFSEDYREENEDESRNYKDVVNFDYAGKRDGFILQIIHTGNPSYIYLDCHIKGGQDIYEIDSYGRKIRNLRDNESLYRFFSKRKIPFAEDRTIDDFKGYSLLTYYFALGFFAISLLGCFLLIISGILPGFDALSTLISDTLFAIMIVVLITIIISFVFLTPVISEEIIPIIVPRRLKKRL